MNARLPDQAFPAPDAEALQAYVDEKWDGEILPALTDYIAVPAKSPAFDADWEKHGYLEKVVRDAAAWVEAQKVHGLALEIVRLPGRTPVIFFEIPATGPDNGDTVLLYGHLDKQPEFSGWRSGLGPWTPKYEDGKLYGRGGADDGYAVYSAITAVKALDKQGVPRPRCVGLIETCEESGSYDLLPYVDALRDRLGNVALVVCLDSGAGNYDQLWVTTSLRGIITGTLEVQVLDEGVHSGDASGVVPSSFRILRHLLDQSRLAHPRLTVDEDQPALTASSLRGVLRQSSQRRLPFQQGHGPLSPRAVLASSVVSPGGAGGYDPSCTW